MPPRPPAEAITAEHTDEVTLEQPSKPPGREQGGSRGESYQEDDEEARGPGVRVSGCAPQ